jgi:hypothetical protein
MGIRLTVAGRGKRQPRKFLALTCTFVTHAVVLDVANAVVVQDDRYVTRG